MMPELLEISRDALRSDLETRVQALLNEAFPEGSSTNGDYYARHGVPGRILIAREAQQVVGHLAVYQRQVKMGDEVLEIGMIGAVAVAPDRRRRGHCRLLLRRAHDDLRARSIPFSILFAFEPLVYLSSGYRPMQNETHFLDADGCVEDPCLSRQHVCGARREAVAEPNARIGWRGRVAGHRRAPALVWHDREARPGVRCDECP
jgi:predicted acetyltransferase